MSCRCDDQDDLPLFDSDGCYNCIEVPRVKGRFGLAWVSESPECPNPEPTGWQVEFYDTPSKVEQKCQEMVRWVNCPPLPRCDPCPPDELCSPKCPPRCNPCAPKTNPCQPRCGPSRSAKRCCCCGGGGGGARGRNCFPPQGMPFCRRRSPGRRRNEPKCTCDDVPVKDTGMDSLGDYTLDTSNNTYYTSTSPKQAITINALGGYHQSSRETVTLYRNENHPYNTDNELERAYAVGGDGGDAWTGEERLMRTLRLDDGAEAKADGRPVFTQGRSFADEVAVSHMQGDAHSRCGPCCSKNIQLQQEQLRKQQAAREQHHLDDDCGCRKDDDKDKHDDKDSRDYSKPKSDDTKSASFDSKHKRHHHILPKFLHHDKHHSMDSLDEALLEMHENKELHAGRQGHHAIKHHGDDQMQQKRVGNIESSRSHHKKQRRRPYWLPPLLFNLCFKSRESRSDHKRKKSKSPHGHDTHGHDTHGHDTHGHDSHGHDTHGHGHDSHGHDTHGHDTHGHGHDSHGHDTHGHDTHGHDTHAHDTHGHHSNGKHHEIHLVTIKESPE